ncbi:MAG: hypothetical protein NUV55_13315 [Sulfuricaulis sp.]|uniref:hypothetical protein n=1 Tax=Sulfuricaulis sp. TaxID=2003553 RepID=UPI0025E24C25|nr:hypothetical protein [Sulfuricaulis sp.]MCR4348161.1 hypothetical protein [Sulfuricaulis sp.]
MPEVVETSLFLGMFSAYDAFTGNLIAEIYRLKPELFNVINRNVPVSEILQFDSFEALKESVLHDEIENFRRKSYVEQFEDMEKVFDLNLKIFDRWPQFVECAQRRNLLTHCDGIVSEQYLQVCKREGYVFSSQIQIGDKLKLGGEYFLPSCELLMEVGLKLGQTLWRKLFPDQINKADSHLIQVTYDSLQREKWKLAQVFGEFAISQKRFSNDLNYKISIIDYAISLKFGGELESADSILKTVDWTAAIDEFKLAEAVLLHKYDFAAEIMNKIGKKGTLISEHAYHDWPLFSEFRATHQFLDAYERIYEYPFVDELKREAIKAEEVASRKESNQEVSNKEK